ncbi:MAG: B12-binding domain-containing radical SAM protein [Promethearchaeota archaeon]
MLLINPPVFHAEEVRIKSRLFTTEKYMNIFGEPMGLMYLASYLRQYGHKIQIIDVLNDKIWNTLRKTIRSSSADIIGISSMTTGIKEALETAKMCKEELSVPIVFGGPHASGTPETLVKHPLVDIAVIGEGEQTFLEIISTLEHGGSLKEVNGICYKNNGNVVKTAPRQLIDDLDSIPWPARDLVEMEKYYMDISSHRGIWSAYTIFASRGCPFNCAFCTSNIWGRRWRKRDPRKVVDEIEVLHEQFHRPGIKFGDFVFNVDRKWVEQICNELLKRGLDIKWSAKASIHGSTPELLDLMNRSGCVLLKYGGESADQEILSLLNKKQTSEEVENVIKWTREADISPHLYFLVGVPQETEESKKQTFEFAKRLFHKYDAKIKFSTLYVFPGTEIEEMAGLKGYDYYNPLPNVESVSRAPLFSVVTGMYSEPAINKIRERYDKYFAIRSGLRYIRKNPLSLTAWKYVLQNL